MLNKPTIPPTTGLEGIAPAHIEPQPCRLNGAAMIRLAVATPTGINATYWAPSDLRPVIAQMMEACDKVDTMLDAPPPGAPGGGSIILPPGFAGG